MTHERAPELDVVQWFNTEAPVSLSDLRGRVVIIEAFQMLCPGCVSHGLPLAQRAASHFSDSDVTVLGLHTVFEHHAAQGTPVALGAFLDEYRIALPVGMDRPSPEGGAPTTMRRFQLRGTPSLVIIDREGFIRQRYFGAVDALALGAEIASLLGEAPTAEAAEPTGLAASCDENGCTIDLPETEPGTTG